MLPDRQATIFHAGSVAAAGAASRAREAPSEQGGEWEGRGATVTVPASLSEAEEAP